MPEIPDLFISPHAVEQFRLRIAPMNEARARFFIGEGIRNATSVKLLPDENTWRIRTRRPFPFEFRGHDHCLGRQQGRAQAQTAGGARGCTRSRLNLVWRA
jgi:hypothetical protein